MTVYVFHDPRREAIDYLTGKLAEYPAGTTVSTDFPTALTAPRLQVAWDGTPDARQQAEGATVRVTYWTPRGQESAANAGASLARKHLLEMATAAVWRVTPGAGRTPGVDPDTGLPFCTFTVIADVRPL